MPRAHFMTHHRQFTGGEASVEVDGATVGKVIENLDAMFPGLGAALRDGTAAGVNGEVFNDPEYLAVDPDTDIYFVAALQGG